MEDSEVRFFLQIVAVSSQELCLCLPEFTSLFTISLTFIRTRICVSYGGNAHEGSVWFV